ncbi:MAG: ABC transporter substrate-binding protein [Christensenellales bacterium]|jgi:peptide/nickel transport system substrate-binding protein
MKRILCALTALCLILLAFSAMAEGADVKGGGVLNVGEYILDTQLANLNPYITTGTANSNLRLLLYDSLTYFNPIDGAVIPMIATEWTSNDDFTQIVLQIREGVTFTDGETLDAVDVAFSINMLNGTALDVHGLWNNIATVEATGEHEVTVLFSAPFPSFPSYLNELFIVPEHIWSAVGDVAAYQNNEPIGSGPFIWGSYTTGTDIQFTANQEYWAGAPQVDRLVIKLYNSSQNLSIALMANEVECTFGTITMSYVTEFLTLPNAHMQLYSGFSNYTVFMNHEYGLLADVNVRKAMGMAIDQTSLIVRGEYNCVYPMNMAWLPDAFGDLVDHESNALLTYDPAGAKQVLEDAGYVLGDDGVYFDPDSGERLSFTYFNASGAPAQQMEAGMIQQWLLNIGVEIIPRVATWAELSSKMQMGDFQLLQNSTPLTNDAYAAFFTSFHSSSTAPSGEAATGRNYNRYRNEALDALIDELATTIDADQRNEIIIQCQQIIANDYIYMPMYNVGGHNPYYDGNNISGWTCDVYPINCPLQLIGVYALEAQQ